MPLDRPSVRLHAILCPVVAPGAGDETPVGRLVMVAWPNGRETCLAYVRWHGRTLLVPVKRAERATDPRGTYVLADGSLWRAHGALEPPVPVWGEAWPETPP